MTLLIKSLLLLILPPVMEVFPIVQAPISIDLDENSIEVVSRNQTAFPSLYSDGKKKGLVNVHKNYIGYSTDPFLPVQI